MNFIFKQFKSYCVLFFFIFLFHFSYAQQTQLSGKFISKTDNSSLVGVGVLLINQKDTNQRKETSADVNGVFKFNNIKQGSYILRAFYIGFKNYETKIIVTQNEQNIGTIKLEETATKLKDVIVEEKMVRSIQRNDTTEYNAAAFKTNSDANTQDLITKMPGITNDNGTVKAQGETVQKVLIDGKEFFGDDAAIALKNLPAEVVDKIQVFDKMSDQAQFTKFDDGNSQKTINITTKSGKSNGQFGKIYGGYGTDEKYTVGENLNFFSGKRRISVIGLSNNINQQNFSTQDLLGVVGTQGNQNRGGPSGGMGGGGRGPGGPGGMGGGNNANNFLTNQQGGINTTHSLGLNYSDMWGKKISVTTSYFFNDAINGTSSDVQRKYFLGSGVNQFYNQTNDATNDNLNHRINMRFEYNYDTSNSIIVTPKLSFQNNSSSSTLFGINSIDIVPLNQTISKNNASNSGYSFSNNILLRHKFLKSGRTISLNLGTDVNNKSGNSSLTSTNQYFFPKDSSGLLEQKTTTASNGYTLSSALIYTEPIGKSGQLMFNYSPSYAKNISDKETHSKDTSTQEFTTLSKTLSNKYDNTLITQRGGGTYRFQNERTNFMIGLNYQLVQLSGTETFPTSFTLSKTFNNVLPNAMYNYKFSKNSNLRMYYRTSTNAPSISQLQSVIDNSNPLLLSSGNPNLVQEYSHMFITRYSLANVEKGRSLFLFLNTTYTANYIGSSTYIGKGTSFIIDGVTLNRGAQLTKPQNLQGYVNIGTFLTYGFPVTFLKSNLNINTGVTYNKTPSLINDAQNDASTYALNTGLVLSSNISEKIDFTVSYSPYYNIVKNSIQTQLNSNYFNQLSSAKFNWLPWKGLVIATDVTHTYYTGLGNGYNVNFFLWNAAIGYKFMKNRVADIRITSFDLLNQNNSISRTVTGTYIEDTKTQVLKRYFMVVFTYNIRNFKMGVAKK